jgi:hypothetical protein
MTALCFRCWEPSSPNVSTTRERFLDSCLLAPSCDPPERGITTGVSPRSVPTTVNSCSRQRRCRVNYDVGACGSHHAQAPPRSPRVRDSAGASYIQSGTNFLLENIRKNKTKEPAKNWQETCRKNPSKSKTAYCLLRNESNRNKRRSSLIRGRRCSRR